MVSVGKKPEGPPAKKGPGLQASGVRPPAGAKGRASPAVPLSEGNEVRWEGAWGVGVLSKYR